MGGFRIGGAATKLLVKNGKLLKYFYFIIDVLNFYYILHSPYQSGLASIVMIMCMSDVLWVLVSISRFFKAGPSEND